ncbi:hypothetical protein LCGC14_0749790 [marine sediment metagenome]|uniref:Lipoprotein n=1 Tax=marine sediment metagenome TaxID=412755 RepID=A0A0F9TBB8_9ZZZZ
MKKVCFIIGLLILIGCAPKFDDLRPYKTPDMVTELGINVWLDGQEGLVDPDELDQYFLDVVDELDYGPVPYDFNLIISKTVCAEYPDGLVYCGFTDPYFSFMLAGQFFPPKDIEIHLMNGEGIDPERRWTLKESAFKHEIEHYVKYWYGENDWDVGEVEYTVSESIE